MQAVYQQIALLRCGIRNLTYRKAVCPILYKEWNMEYSTEEKLEWIIYFIYEFGKKYDLTMKQAFGYLQRFKAIDFIDKHYGYAHTQSFNTMVDELSQYCRRMGGAL